MKIQFTLSHSRSGWRKIVYFIRQIFKKVDFARLFNNILNFFLFFKIKFRPLHNHALCKFTPFFVHTGRACYDVIKISERKLGIL